MGHCIPPLFISAYSSLSEYLSHFIVDFTSR